MTQVLAPRQDPSRRQMPLCEWPLADQAAWSASMHEGDILDGGGPAAHWAAATRRSVMKGYGRWLTWLARREALDLASQPACRVTPKLVAAYVADLRQQTASYTVRTYVQALAQAVQAFAPEANRDWLWAIVNGLSKRAVPVRNKWARIVPSKDLYDYGFALMREAETDQALSPLRRASRYRDGLMIALLSARPFRIKNSRSIEIGRHLIRLETGYTLQFEAGETKTRRRLEADLPKPLVAALETYLTIHRPALLAARKLADPSCAQEVREDGLWISQIGTRMAEITIFNRLVDLTRAKFGRRVNPHLFRDCAATSIAEHAAEHSAITMNLLGHTSAATAERYYNHAQSNEAVRVNQAQIGALRKEAARQASYADERKG